MNRPRAGAACLSMLLSTLPAASWAGRFSLGTWVPPAAGAPEAPVVEPVGAQADVDGTLGFFEGSEDSLIWKQSDLALSSKGVQDSVPGMKERDVARFLQAVGKGNWLLMRDLKDRKPFFVFCDAKDGKVYYDPVKTEIEYGPDKLKLSRGAIRALGGLLAVDYASAQSGLRTLRGFAPDSQGSQSFLAVFQFAEGSADALQQAWVLDPVALGELYGLGALAGIQSGLTAERRKRISEFLSSGKQGLLNVRVKASGSVVLKLMKEAETVDFLAFDGQRVEGTF